MKNLFLVAILLLIVSSLSFGQNASVTADVRTALSISSGTNLDFGIVQKGTTATILSTAATATAFTIAGEPGASIAVTVTFPGTLTGPGAPITFTGQTPIHNTTSDQGTATAFSGLTGGSTPAHATTGNLYVWMGGGISPGVGQVSGSYSGTITVAVAYP